MWCFRRWWSGLGGFQNKCTTENQRVMDQHCHSMQMRRCHPLTNWFSVILRHWFWHLKFRDTATADTAAPSAATFLSANWLSRSWSHGDSQWFVKDGLVLTVVMHHMNRWFLLLCLHRGSLKVINKQTMTPNPQQWKGAEWLVGSSPIVDDGVSSPVPRLVSQPPSFESVLWSFHTWQPLWALQTLPRSGEGLNLQPDATLQHLDSTQVSLTAPPDGEQPSGFCLHDTSLDRVQSEKSGKNKVTGPNSSNEYHPVIWQQQFILIILTFWTLQ